MRPEKCHLPRSDWRRIAASILPAGLRLSRAPARGRAGVETGHALIEEDGADVVIMGCAGMARHRRALEHALGVPVIDPTQAAVAMAIGTVQVGS
jgi:Asp/Glu/hydantoin racemase